MTRHGKNCTAGAVYTYHERKRDTAASGYGSQKLRFGKDSVKSFDCCSLTLQPCANAVITPDGYLYDKEAILQYILSKKRDIARKLKEYSKQKTKAQKEIDALSEAERESQIQKFKTMEGDIISKPINAFAQKDTEKNGKAEASGSSSSSGQSISNMAGGKDKVLPSFWIPALTPQATPTVIKKPDEKVRCPMSGKPLKLSNLIDIHFTAIKDGDSKTSVIAKENRYVCAVTNDILGNSVPCAVLRTSGNVVTVECIDKIIRKDMVDPTNSKRLTEKDIIMLQRGASGFSAAGVTLEAKQDGPALMS